MKDVVYHTSIDCNGVLYQNDVGRLHLITPDGIEHDVAELCSEFLDHYVQFSVTTTDKMQERTGVG